MEILGIGPTELLLIIILALVIVGPRDLAKLGRDAGRALNRLYRSPMWRTMNEASREIRNLPTRLAREAELDSVQRDLQQAGRDLRDSARSASRSIEQDIRSAAQAAERPLEPDRDGMQAWTAPPAAPPPAPASSPLPKDVKPSPPSESPFAEG